MVNNSIYTNPSAYTALQNLTVINRKLEISQSAISSGLRVASATDDTSSFAIAQGIRGEIASIESTKRNVIKIKGIVDYNLAATEGIANLMGEIKAKLTELQDTTLSTSQRAAVISDFNNLLSQGKDFARGAANLDQIGGQRIDLFSASGTVRGVTNVTANIAPTLSGTTSAAASTVTINSALTVAVFNRLSSLQSGARTATAANATSTITTDFVSFETEIASALGHLGGKSEQLENQTEFLDSIKNSRQELLGSYVDADLAAESAKLTALQVQQQLAIQSVGIANQRPQSLLGLFR